MSYSKYIIVFVLFCICGSSAIAQHGVSIIYAPSKVIKHRDNLRFGVPDRSHEFRLAYTYQTTGEKRWEQYWHKPRVTVNALLVNFGDKEVLGNALAILPEIHFTLARWNKLKLNMQFGTGIAHLNKPFNPITNPDNNAIGSNLNNVTSLKFGLDYSWNDQFSSSLSTGIVHFSNGLSSSPNSGINIYGLSIGTVYQFKKKEESLKEDILTRSENEEVPSYRKWIADVQYHYGFTELRTPGGPKFGVQAISVGGGYRYSEFMTLLVGGEYEYNDATYNFFRSNFETEEFSKEKAKKTILYVENEFRYGPVFNRFRVGMYLGWPSENSKDVYLKLVTGIYLPKIKNYPRPYIGVVLKTHTAVADYLGVMVGFSI